MDTLQQRFYDLHGFALDAVTEMTRLHLGPACQQGKNACIELAAVHWQMICHESGSTIANPLTDPVLLAHAQDLAISKPLRRIFENFDSFFNRLPQDPVSVEEVRFELLGILRRADLNIRLWCPDLTLPELPRYFASTYSVSPIVSFTSPRPVVHRQDNAFWYEENYQPGAEPQYRLPITVDEILDKSELPTWARVVQQAHVLRKFRVV